MNCTTDGLIAHGPAMWLVDGQPRCRMCVDIMLAFVDNSRFKPILEWVQPTLDFDVNELTHGAIA